jgi:hypothetical protein
LVTWPARQALAAGRGWWGARRRAKPAAHDLGVEATVLCDTLDALLTGLQRDVGRRCRPTTAGYAFWLALEQKLEAELPRVRHVFDAAIAAHHRQVSEEIHAAAHRLYAELQKSPKRLAALRAARATIDVGAVVLAMKTGGLSLLDAVWAPATFALTSLLMEGIAGLEMGRGARELKLRQRAAVERALVGQMLLPQLTHVTAGLEAAGLFGLAPADLRTATEALARWETQP